MSKSGTSRDFWRRMHPDSLQEASERFSREVPQKPKAAEFKKPPAAIRPVELVEYRDKCRSAQLEPAFKRSLKSLLKDIEITADDSTATLAQKINAHARQFSQSIISCSTVGNELYFVFHPKENEFGFFYVPVDIVLSLKYKAINEAKR